MKSAWNPNENGNNSVKINGVGDYTATWNLNDDSDTIDSLILQSNIKIDEDKTLATSGIKIKVNYISTVGEGSTASTTATSTDTATTTTADTTTTTTADNATTTTTTTTTAVNVAENLSPAPSTPATPAPIANAPAPTGDSGIGTALTLMTLAGVSAISLKKKNK